MIPGLASVTFRQLGWREVIKIAVSCGLEAIEWGGDIHAPPGEIALAREIRQATENAGLSVLSYGSYYRLGTGGDFGPILASARALQAGIIRVWPGVKGSAQYDVKEFEQAAADARAIADMAAPHGIAIAFEFHRGTLTDTGESALALLSAINRGNARTYWQPNPERSHEANLAALKLVLPHLENLHVHVTERDKKQLPLEAVAPLWQDYMQAAKGHARAALIEFVKGGDPAQCALDAETLMLLCG